MCAIKYSEIIVNRLALASTSTAGNGTSHRCDGNDRVAFDTEYVRSLRVHEYPAPQNSNVACDVFPVVHGHRAGGSAATL